MNKNNILHIPLFIFVLCLSLILVGCGGGGDDGDSTEVTVSASKDEGIAPVNISFSVHGVDESDIYGVYWSFGDGSATATSYLDESHDVSHTYTTGGYFTAYAIVSLWSGGSYLGTHEVTVTPDVNLEVVSFAIDDVVSPCNVETVEAIIQNTGTMDLRGAGDIRVGYYLSTDDTITVDDIYIGDTNIVVGDYFLQSDVPFGFEYLGPMENYQYVHQISTKCNIPGGTYYAGAFIDFLEEYHWYDFPRTTDTEEYVFPTNATVWESNEADNTKVLPAYAVTVVNPTCTDDIYEDDDSGETAKTILPGESQEHNLCFDNSDWLKFHAAAGRVYKIWTSKLGGEIDPQLILYDRDANSILLFEDNKRIYPDCTDISTVDLKSGWPTCDANAEIVWEAEFEGNYFIKVRTTSCDEDNDPHCLGSPDGVGLYTDYTISFEEL